VHLSYNGRDISRDIAPFLVSFSYTDHAGSQLDEISLELQALDDLWGGQWFPAEGDTITAAIVAYDWDSARMPITPVNAPSVLPCGTYQVSDITVDGPPERVSLACISAPLTRGLRRQRKHKAWENIRLQAIAADIAAGAGMRLLYDTAINPLYTRKDQQFQSDLAFLQDFCTTNGLRLKVQVDRLVIFSEAEYEQHDPAFTIDKLDGLYTGYSFRTSLAESYRSCEVSYTDAKGTTGYAATFTPPQPPSTGEVLKLNERVESQVAAVLRARTALREKNREAQTARFTVPYHPRLVGAVTGTLRHWRPRYNGTYMVDSVTHTIGGGAGSTSSVEMHKALIGY